MITISQVLRSSLWKWAHRPTMSLKWTGMTFIGGNKSIFKSLLLCICLMSQSAAQIIRTTVHTVQGQNFIDVCRRLFVFSHDVWRSHVFSPWCTDLGWDKGCWYIAHFYSLDEPWDVPRHRLSLRHFKDKVGLLSVHCMNTNVFQHLYIFPLTGIWIQPKSLLKHFSQHNGDEDKLIVYPHIWCLPQRAPKLEADHSVNQPVTKPANRENLQHCHKVFIFTSLVIMS